MYVIDHHVASAQCDVVSLEGPVGLTWLTMQVDGAQRSSVLLQWCTM